MGGAIVAGGLGFGQTLADTFHAHWILPASHVVVAAVAFAALAMQSSAKYETSPGVPPPGVPITDHLADAAAVLQQAANASTATSTPGVSLLYYDAGTIYAKGQTVIYASQLWTSKQDKNTGHAPSDPASADWWTSGLVRQT